MTFPYISTNQSFKDNTLSKIIVVDGPLAAGKTTLLNTLEKRGFSVRKEDTKSWTNYFGQNLLEKHYADIQIGESWRRSGQNPYEHNALLSGTRTLQTKIIADFVRVYNQVANYDDLVILERDLDTISSVFLPLNRELLTFIDYQIMSEIVESTKHFLDGIPKVKIYLDIPLNEGFSRLGKRNRSGEVVSFNTYRKIWAKFDEYKESFDVIINTSGKTERQIADEVQGIITDFTKAEKRTNLKTHLQSFQDTIRVLEEKLRKSSAPQADNTQQQKSTLTPYFDPLIHGREGNDYLDEAPNQEDWDPSSEAPSSFS